MYGIVGAVQDADGNDVIVTDRSWSCSNKAEDGWADPDFEEGDNWEPAVSVTHEKYSLDDFGWFSLTNFALSRLVETHE